MLNILALKGLTNHYYNLTNTNRDISLGVKCRPPVKASRSEWPVKGTISQDNKKHHDALGLKGTVSSKEQYLGKLFQVESTQGAISNIYIFFSTFHIVFLDISFLLIPAFICL